MDSDEIRCISLCSGYEGIGLGLRRVLPNMRVVAYAEIEEYACSVLAARMEEGKLDVAPIWTDLKTFPGEAFHGKVHGIFCGYPCQPFSHTGKRQGAEDPRHLWPHIARIIEAVRPVWFFGENVPGHLTLGFPEVYCSLRDMGYQVEAGLFTAAEVGAPHKRQRLFILASSEDAGGGRQVQRRQEKGRTIARGAGENVAHSQRPEPRLRIRQEREAGIGRDRLAVGGEGMADAARIHGTAGERQVRGRRRVCESSETRWPARAGQPQYEWEEPRVVADAAGARTRQDARNSTGTQGQGNEEAQSGVGRAANGPSSRVDRLRLLGNGVVPQQAEKAFRELIARKADEC